jgi:hypothetical protein
MKTYEYVKDLVCEECNTKFSRRYDHYIQSLNKFSKCYCRKCALKHKSKYVKNNNTILKFTCERCSQEFERSELKHIQLLNENNNHILCGKHSQAYKHSKFYKLMPESAKKEFKKRMSKSSSFHTYNRAQKGKTLEERLGKEKADKCKLKAGKSRTGEKNGQFGKPVPNGCGNGWSGWYKNQYFRSLKELSFLVNFIEKQNLQFQSAENKKFKIPYIGLDNKQHNYFADFIIGNMLIEIKPKGSKNWKQNKIKFDAAIAWCKEHNMVFKCYGDDEYPQLSFNDIKLLELSKEIRFTDKYQKKFDELYKKFEQ